MLMPRKPTPPLSLPLVGGGRFDLDADPGAERGTLLVVYRGLHCPLCVPYLQDLDAIAPGLAARGVTALALSTDDGERAAAMRDKAGAKAVRFAHSLPLAEARAWGLYLSTGRGRTSAGVEEPALFAEPGLFLVGPRRALYFVSVQNMPFMRPDLAGLPKMLDAAIERNYPARGEWDGDRAA
jgi:peroxiredoxin